MIIYKRAVPEAMQSGPGRNQTRSNHPRSSSQNLRTGLERETTPGDVSSMPPLQPINDVAKLAEYRYQAGGAHGKGKYARVAPEGTPEWYGVEDDLVLISIWELLPLRDGHKHRRLSKQMQRVCTRALEQKLKLSPEQAVAFNDAMAGRNVFLTGGAGVGKSHTLTQIVKYLPSETYSVTASTGCAAAIIGAATLHSTMGIGLATQPAKSYVHKIKKNVPVVYQRVRRIKTLILDEVSMLDGATFNKAGLVASILRHRGDCSEEMMGNAAAFTLWDNMQLICCGDFMQLPPVKVKDHGWIFESRAWKELKFRNHVLTWIHRQAGDPLFAEVLGRIRLGNATDNDMSYLVENSAGEEPGNCLKLFALNAPADQLNATRYHELIQAGVMPHTFTAIDSGDKKHLLEQCQAPKQLHLCEGARVMCLRNLIDGQLVNGSTGTVTAVRPFRDLVAGKITGATVHVRFDGMLGTEPFEHVFRTYESCMPEAEVARTYEFTVMEGKKKVASRVQIPLRLAWAVSMHKSQGMSLERASIDFNGIFEDGQAYTALSRMRTLKGVYLKGLMLRHLKMASKRAQQWYEGITWEEWSRV
jgi:ATP-dependent DNA helicase PIF1